MYIFKEPFYFQVPNIYVLLYQIDSGEYTFTIKQPWFDYIKTGIKTVEGRLNRGIFAKLKPGDTIKWIHKKMKCKVTVIYIKKYDTFKELLEKEDIKKVLPNIKSTEQGVEIYHKYYSYQDKEYGVVAIGMQPSDSVTTHESKLKEPHYTNIAESKKIYEIRVNDEKRRQMKVDDIWIFSNNDEPHKPKIKTRIVEIKTYKTFEEAIKDSNLNQLLPNVNSQEEAIKLYENFPHDEGTYKEGAKKYGVVRFKIDIMH